VKAVDLFAGFGGLSLGAKRAGVNVVWAANHWKYAVETHAANHPETEHVCQDLRQADWSRLPRFDMLLAAPACQGHSKASQPKRTLFHDALRATAWAVVDCAEVTRPELLVVENVPDFLNWQLYPLWKQALELLGFGLQELRLTASYHGVPQRRQRLLIVGMRGRTPKLTLKPEARELPFGPCIEWDAPGWRPTKEASAGAQARFAVAQANHGAQCLSQHVSGHPGAPLDEPIRTITTKDQWVVLDGRRYRPLTEREYARAMSFPDSYTWAPARRRDVVQGLGNAVPPVLAEKVVRALLEAA
jgi:DNA (cytosine-5)-methyltransferase 1